MKSHHTVAEFAELAGVTVKALHHYDRLGLLRPRRSDSGYRLYASRDLERLEQIVALKSVGLTLNQIKAALDGDAAAVAAALGPQRRALERKRAELDRLIRAIETVEASVASTRTLSSSRVLNQLIEAIDMQNDLDLMERYFKTDAAWTRGRRYFEAWPTEAWRQLFREVQAALREDPASDHACSLAAQWSDLFRSDTNGDFAFRAGLWRAWHDFHEWPESLKQPVAKFDFAALSKFIADVSWARVGADGRLPDADPRRAPDRVSLSKIELFRALNQPNEVAFGRNGDFFLAEGHTPGAMGDPRVLKFDKNGNLIKQWGGKGTAPGKFEVAHGIVINAKGELWVTDRENQRIQVFDQDGNYLREMKYAGLPCALEIGKDAIWMTNGFTGQILKLDMDGKVLAAMGKPGDGPGEFGEAHYITVSPKGDLYVADVTKGVMKFVKK